MHIPEGHGDIKLDRFGTNENDREWIMSSKVCPGVPEDTGRCYTLSPWFSVKRRLSVPWKGPVSLDNTKNDVKLTVL